MDVSLERSKNWVEFSLGREDWLFAGARSMDWNDRGVRLGRFDCCCHLADRFNAERVGDISSRIGLFLGFMTFVVVWIRQANRRERQPPEPPKPPPTTPEKLEPIDYSQLPHLYDDPKASDQKGPSA